MAAGTGVAEVRRTNRLDAFQRNNRTATSNTLTTAVTTHREQPGRKCASPHLVHEAFGDCSRGAVARDCDTQEHNRGA